MSVRRGFVIRLRAENKVERYVKPDGNYTVDLLNARLYASREEAAPDLPRVHAYVDNDWPRTIVDTPATTIVASIG